MKCGTAAYSCLPGLLNVEWRWSLQTGISSGIIVFGGPVVLCRAYCSSVGRLSRVVVEGRGLRKCFVEQRIWSFERTSGTAAYSCLFGLLNVEWRWSLQTGISSGMIVFGGSLVLRNPDPSSVGRLFTSGRKRACFTEVGWSCSPF
jgi:hypothetical protein